ncbi:MAG: autoinducer binding domain-containing protein [Tatlockia sp.]|nr:autoinducer binding domain-containing protein [Tatlockia sp.]
MNKELQTLENELAEADTISDCDVALSSYLTKKGICTFSFTYYAYHPSSENKLKYDMCSANFRVWHQHYLEEEYDNIDSTLGFVYNHNLPIHWNLKQQLAQASSESERKMRQDSMDFGAEEGLSIPIHGAHNNFAILLLVQMQNDRCNLRKQSLQHEFFVASYLYFHFIQVHLLNEAMAKKSFRLTQREIQCLLLIAKQYSVKQMAQYLELTERTVNFHIQKLNKKLGTKNKYQSLAKALEQQLLTL